jgi:DNA-binding PadR family transcriptional regulator
VFSKYIGGKKLNKKIFHGPILESILLNLVNETSDQGQYGYALAKLVQKRFGILLGSSTIYPELNRLEKQGLMTSIWEVSLGRPRKKYIITPKGQNLVKQYSLEFRNFLPAAVSHKNQI